MTPKPDPALSQSVALLLSCGSAILKSDNVPRQRDVRLASFYSSTTMLAGSRPTSPYLKKLGFGACRSGSCSRYAARGRFDRSVGWIPSSGRPGARALTTAAAALACAACSCQKLGWCLVILCSSFGAQRYAVDATRGAPQSRLGERPIRVWGR